MQEFKINVYFKDSDKTFQELIKELFINYINDNLNINCENTFKELVY